MMRWEYRTFRIKYEGKTHKNWVVERGDRPPLVGLGAILEAQGTRGWELVSLETEHAEVYSGWAKWWMRPVVYRATFKRPIEA